MWLLMLPLALVGPGAHTVASEPAGAPVSSFSLDHVRWQSRDQADRVRESLGVGGGAFALRLVGKDGGIKLSRDTVVSMEEIYGLIDTMPMRRNEMER